ncbi:hypothetical protein TNCV_1246381 [Trichonephila clavipes]|uniref:Uncharacterized protein n=1 Tax=Trichonephila clavipes TaxID=2585209 RepID=A0A8X6RA33_TRICX|nr:hypothetical protein TNCV_1246381 [Trichonephila clavipes]
MLNDDKIVTFVQAESDPVDDETDEDKNNNSESSKCPSKFWHVFCVRDSYGVVRTTIRLLSDSTTAAQENQRLCSEKRRCTMVQRKIIHFPQ